MNLFWVYSIDVYGLFADIPFVHSAHKTEVEAMAEASVLVSLGKRAFVECQK